MQDGGILTTVFIQTIATITNIITTNMNNDNILNYYNEFYYHYPTQVTLLLYLYDIQIRKKITDKKRNFLQLIYYTIEASIQKYAKWNSCNRNPAQTKLHTWHRCMCSRHDAYHRDSSSTARICCNHTASTTATHCTIYHTLILQYVF